MTKRTQKKTPAQVLDERLQTLMSKRLKAFRAGASQDIMEQLDRMIAETELDLYTETELQRNRDDRDNEDGEQWIV